jgi:outer membrane receptor for monomeric catechols
MAGVALEQSLPTGTYLAVNAEWLSSDVDREVGVVEFDSAFSAGSTPQNLDYEERSLTVTANQLIGHEWSVGARYRLSNATLDSDFPGLVPFGSFTPKQRVEATLNQVNLYAVYNHPSGFFGQFESLWMGQNNSGYTPALPYDSFWQFNVFAGFRFPRRRAEIRLGILNLTDQDYNLNPLNLTPYLWRDRTFTATLRFNF